MSLLELKQQHENNITLHVRLFLDIAKQHETEPMQKPMQLIEKIINKISKWELTDEKLGSDYIKNIKSMFLSIADYYDHVDAIDQLIILIDQINSVCCDVSASLKNDMADLLKNIKLAHAQFIQERKINDNILIKYIGDKVLTSFAVHTSIPIEKIKAQIKMESALNDYDNDEDKHTGDIRAEDTGLKANDSDTSNDIDNIDNNNDDTRIDNKKPNSSKKTGSAQENNTKSTKDSSTQKIIKAIADIRNQYHEHPRSIVLYAYVMQILSDVMFTHDKGALFKILLFLEEDKNLCLDGNTNNYFAPRQLAKDNPPLKKFGLIPITDSVPIKQLLSLVLSENNISTSDTNLRKISKAHKIGFIVFNRVVYTPIEYNIRPLIIKNIAKDFIQPDEYGINIKTIDRFKTIRDFSKQEWNFSVEVFGNDFETFYVFETLDGINYRCMAPWVNSKIYGLQRFRIEHILKYIANEGKPNRAANYHSVMQKKMTQNMFLRKAVDIDALIEKVEDNNAHTIRTDIYETIMKYVDNVIKKQYHSDIKSSVEISEIIHDKEIPKIFFSKIIANYEKGADRDDIINFKAGCFPFEEILVSYMVELQYITRRLSKELHDGYSRNVLADDVFTKPKKEKMSIVNDKLAKVIDDAIKLIIKDDKNMYLSLRVKYSILNDTQIIV
jgi:hypothetical protein